MNSSLKFLTIFLLLLLSNCGFKVSKSTIYNDFYVQSIETTNSKKIDYKIRQAIKNKLPNNKANQKIFLKINNKQIKSISEKNIKNQITKYEIVLNTKIEINFLTDNLEKVIEVSSKGTYSVGNAHKDTKKNQENLEHYLAEKNVDKFFRNLENIKDDN